EHPALAAVGGEVAIEEDRLAGRALADEPREAEVRGPGNDPLLARRKVEVGAGLRDHAIHHEQDLARAADRERLDRGDERLLPAILGQRARLPGGVGAGPLSGG